MSEFLNFVTNNSDLIITILILVSGGSGSSLVVAIKKFQEAQGVAQTIIQGVECYANEKFPQPNADVKIFVKTIAQANGNLEVVHKLVKDIT